MGACYGLDVSRHHGPFGSGATAAELCAVKLLMKKKTGVAQFDSALSKMLLERCLNVSVIEVGNSLEKLLYLIFNLA